MDNSMQQFLEEFSFKKIFNLNPSQYQEGHSAIRLQVINRGEDAVEIIISTVVLNIIPVAVQIIFAITAISFYSKTVALWCFFSIIVVVIWSNRFSRFHRPYIQKNMDNWDIQRKIRTEAFQHLNLIKLSGAESTYLAKYLENRLEVLEHRILTFTLSLRYNFNRGLFLQISKSVSTVLIFILALQSKITVGTVYALWSWINDAFSSIQSLTQIIKNIPIRFVELEKYLDIIDTKPLFDEHGQQITEPLKEDILFTDVSFKYPQAEISLFEGLTLTIPAKKTTAFVGESGSGKSTIVKLLMRSYDYGDGTITFGHTEIRLLDARTLRRHIGYVEQHVDLFDDTIRENIFLGVEESERDAYEVKLDDIARHARIDQFFHRLGEKKFDTILGERGIKLSGGERQRIGIARAIIKNPEILIFDEATSSLDAENESKVMEAINDVSRDKTTIIIAHRLSTVRNADKIIVMDKGRVVGEGTHNELLTSNEIYQNLVAHQMSDSK
jgi:ATP-binding cassette subfamily B protein